MRYKAVIWIVTILHLLWAGAILADPNSVKSASFQALTVFFPNPYALASVFIVASILAIMAMRNGHRPLLLAGLFLPQNILLCFSAYAAAVFIATHKSLVTGASVPVGVCTVAYGYLVILAIAYNAVLIQRFKRQVFDG